MKANNFFLLIFFVSLGLFAQQIPDGMGRIAIEVLDGVGEEMSADNKFKPRITLIFTKKHAWDNTDASRSQKQLSLNPGENAIVVPGIYTVRLEYGQYPDIFKENIVIERGESNTFKISDLGRLQFEVKDGIGNNIARNNPAFPHIKVDNIISSSGEYLDLLANEEYIIQYSYAASGYLNTAFGRRDFEGAFVRKDGVRVIKGKKKLVTSIDLGRIYPKAFNGLGKEINVPILIKKGEYDVTTAMSGEYVDLVGGQNKYTVLFKYSSDIEVKKEGISIIAGKDNFVESKEISRISVNAINAFGNTDDIRIEVKQNKETIGYIKPNGFIDVKTGDYKVICKMRDEDEIIKDVHLNPGIEEAIEFKSPYGGLEVLPMSGLGGDAKTVNTTIKKGTKYVKSISGHGTVKLMPGEYLVEFVYSRNNKVERKVTILQNKLYPEQVKMELGVVHVKAQDAMGKSIENTCHIYGIKGELHGVKKTGESIELPPGSYVVKYKDHSLETDREIEIDVIAGKPETVWIGNKNYGRLSWKVKGSGENPSLNSFTIKQGKELISHKSIGISTYIDLPVGEYRGEFEIDNGPDITKDKLLIVKGKTLPIILESGQGRLEWSILDFKGKPLSPLKIFIKTPKGGLIDRYIGYYKYMDLPPEKYQISYELEKAVVPWRTFNLKNGPNVDEIKNMGRLVFDVIDETGEDVYFNLAISKDGNLLKEGYSKDYIDLTPGRYELTFKLDREDHIRKRTITVIAGELQPIKIGGENGKIKLLAKDMNGQETDDRINIYKAGESRLYKSGQSSEVITVAPGEYDVEFPKKIKKENILVRHGEEVLVEMQEGKAAVKFITVDAIGAVVDVTVGILKGTEFIKKINSSETTLLNPEAYNFEFIYPGPFKIIKENVQLKADQENLVEVIPDQGRLTWELKDDKGEILKPEVQIVSLESDRNITVEKDYVDLASGNYKAKFKHPMGLDAIIDKVTIVRGKTETLQLSLTYGSVKFEAFNGLRELAEVMVKIKQGTKVIDNVKCGSPVQLPIGDYTAIVKDWQAYTKPVSFIIKKGEVNSNVELHQPSAVFKVNILDYMDKPLRYSLMGDYESFYIVDGKRYNFDANNKEVLVLPGQHTMYLNIDGEEIDAVLNIVPEKLNEFNINFGAIRAVVKDGQELPEILEVSLNNQHPSLFNDGLIHLPKGDYTLDFDRSINPPYPTSEVSTAKYKGKPSKLSVEWGKVSTTEIECINCDLGGIDVKQKGYKKNDLYSVPFDFKSFDEENEKYADYQESDGIGGFETGNYQVKIDYIMDKGYEIRDPRSGRYLLEPLVIGPIEVEKRRVTVVDLSEYTGDVTYKLINKKGSEVDWNRFEVAVYSFNKEIGIVERGYVTTLKSGIYDFKFSYENKEVWKQYVKIPSGKKTLVEADMDDVKKEIARVNLIAKNGVGEDALAVLFLTGLGGREFRIEPKKRQEIPADSYSSYSVKVDYVSNKIADIDLGQIKFSSKTDTLFKIDNLGRLEINAYNKNGEETEYFMQVYDLDEKPLYNSIGTNSYFDLPAGTYDLKFSVDGEDVKINYFTVVAGMKNPVKVDLSKEELSSDFSMGTEGWKIVGDAQGNSTEPIYTGGSIKAKDDAVGGVWYWKAPEAYLGNQSRLYGRKLSYRLKTNNIDTQFDHYDIVLKGAGKILTYDTELNPGINWTDYQVGIHESTGWMNKSTGQPVTQIELKEVLSDISELLIRGEFRTGDDTGWLDFVGFN